MGGVNAKPVVSKTSDVVSICDQELQITIGGCSMQGWRKYQEDRYSYHMYRHPKADGEPITCTVIISLFDGHGGHSTSEACKRLWGPFLLSRLHPELLESYSIDTVQPHTSEVGLFTREVVESTFLLFDNTVLRSAQHNTSGTTATVLVINTRLQRSLLGHLGDSRALILPFQRMPMYITLDHGPELPQEIARVEKAGLRVSQGRVLFQNISSLNLTRSLGDKNYKMNKMISPAEQAITAFPDVHILDFAFKKGTDTVTLTSTSTTGTNCAQCLCLPVIAKSKLTKRDYPCSSNAYNTAVASTVKMDVKSGSTDFTIYDLDKCICTCHNAVGSFSDVDKIPDVPFVETTPSRMNNLIEDEEEDVRVVTVSNDATPSKTPLSIVENSDTASTTTENSTNTPKQQTLSRSTTLPLTDITNALESDKRDCARALDGKDLVFFLATDGIWNGAYLHNHFPGYVSADLNEQVSHHQYSCLRSPVYVHQVYTMQLFYLEHIALPYHTYCYSIPALQGIASAGIPPPLLQHIAPLSYGTDDANLLIGWHMRALHWYKSMILPQITEKPVDNRPIVLTVRPYEFPSTLNTDESIDQLLEECFTAYYENLHYYYYKTSITTTDSLYLYTKSGQPATGNRNTVFNKDIAVPNKASLDLIFKAKHFAPSLNTHILGNALLQFSSMTLTMLIANGTYSTKGSSDNMTALTVVVRPRQNTEETDVKRADTVFHSEKILRKEVLPVKVENTEADILVQQPSPYAPAICYAPLKKRKEGEEAQANQKKQRHE